MSRGVATALAVVLLVAACVTAAATVGAVVATDPGTAPPVADLRLSVDGDADRLILRHAGGEAIPAESIRLRVRVNGTALAHQPPVPFFAARGFRAGPTGPFNPSTVGPWRAGQTAALRLASTNHPRPAPGDRVTVRVSTESAVIAELAATAN